MEPQLKCWTSSMTGDADAIFDSEDITSPDCLSAISTSKRLSLVGDWGKKDIGGRLLRFIHIIEI